MWITYGFILYNLVFVSGIVFWDIKLVLFGPSRFSNFIDGLFIDRKGEHILTRCTKKNRKVVAKYKFDCILKCFDNHSIALYTISLKINSIYCLISRFLLNITVLTSVVI